MENHIDTSSLSTLTRDLNAARNLSMLALDVHTRQNEKLHWGITSSVCIYHDAEGCKLTVCNEKSIMRKWWKTWINNYLAFPCDCLWCRFYLCICIKNHFWTWVLCENCILDVTNCWFSYNVTTVYYLRYSIINV